jgi:hypothetical protein
MDDVHEPSENEALEQNDQFAGVLAIVCSKRLLNIQETASAVATCTDTRDRVQPLLTESPISLNSGPLEMLCNAPSQLCSVCSRAETQLRCPLEPHVGRVVCERCWEHNHLKELGFLSWREARNIYKVTNDGLKKLQWAQSPHRWNQRYFRGPDVRSLAIQEAGGMAAFQVKRDKVRSNALARRRTNLVKHYDDLSALGMAFERQIYLAGLRIRDCINLRVPNGSRPLDEVIHVAVSAQNQSEDRDLSNHRDMIAPLYSLKRYTDFKKGITR